METVYVLLEKDLKSEGIHVVGVYTSYELAEEVMDAHMEMYEEERSYKIVDRMVV
jgi:hypothetical protein